MRDLIVTEADWDIECHKCGNKISKGELHLHDCSSYAIRSQGDPTDFCVACAAKEIESAEGSLPPYDKMREKLGIGATKEFYSLYTTHSVLPEIPTLQMQFYKTKTEEKYRYFVVLKMFDSSTHKLILDREIEVSELSFEERA